MSGQESETGAATGSDTGRGIVFHVPENWISDTDAILPFYRRNTDALISLGIRCKLVPMNRDTVLDEVAADDWFHILNHGRITHPRVLNAGIAYVYPYWHLDPTGIRAFSSIGEKPFRPGMLDGQSARRFTRRLRAKQVAPRTSRYAQPEEVEALPKAAAAIFLQSENHRNVGETLYMDRWTMVEATCSAVSGPVIVKPHPRELETEVFDRLLNLQKRHGNLHISLGNIHDIIAVSDRVVTINSAVGVEALMHEKPLILCGRTDFHHIATTAQTPDQLTHALTTPPPSARYAKYLYWYFGLQCLDASAPDLGEQLLTRIRATGYEI